MTIALTFLIKLLLTGLFAEQAADRSMFISPLRIPLSLSSNFGELRSDHFHSGIDIGPRVLPEKKLLPPQMDIFTG
jgi:murein DD-endopeptidase MepM/ murein hydrolase activator NlpD